MNLKQILSTLPSLNEKRNKTFLKGEKTVEKKVYRLPKVSKKRMKKEAIYAIRRPMFLKERIHCQIRRPECTGKATEVHHFYDGADRDKYFLDETTWIGTCGVCHRWVHNYPQAASALGFLSTKS